MNRTGRTKGLLWQKAVTKVVTIGLKMDLVRSKTMRSRKQEGFSLIELLCVVVIIGVIAALAVPALMKARLGAENGTTFATLRSVNSTEVSFFSSNGRFGRLSEVKPRHDRTIG